MTILDIVINTIPNQQEAWVWFIIPIIIGVIIAILVSSNPLPDKETRSVVILGTKGAGKTSLWNALRGIKEATTPTYQEKISQFELKFKDKTVSIEETNDLGGSDSLLSAYEGLIKDHSFTYFLFNINRLDEKEEINSIVKQLSEIKKIIKKRDSVGLKFVGTHCDECNADKNTLFKKIQKKLSFRKILKEENIHLLNLQDPKDVEIIINEIVNNITDYA